MKPIYSKTRLVIALGAVLGVSANVQAATVSLSWTGAFTMLNSTGSFLSNTDTTVCYPGMLLAASSCLRTAITGTLTYDTVSGAGSGTITPFSFLGSSELVVTSLNLQAIGNGVGGPGSLVLGNMSWNWNGNTGIPSSLVWDASGLQSAVAGGVTAGQSITGGALAASDNTKDGLGGFGSTHPIGPAIMATTTWNTTLVGSPCSGTGGSSCLGRNPSGTLPLVTDTVVDATNGDIGIGGSRMVGGPFQGFNVNIDIVSASVVPVPSAVWLFGSGLAGLMSLVRRRRG